MLKLSRVRLGAFGGGVVWAGLSGGIAIVLPFAMFLLFARLLPPAVIGHVALVVVLAEMVKMLGLPGLYEALLQRRVEDARTQGAALGLFLLLGAALVGVQSGLLLGTLSFTGSEVPAGELALLLLMGLKIPIELALLQPQAELARRQAYARLAQRNMAANLGASLIGLLVLALGYPLAGLAAYTLGFSLAAGLATVVGTGALRRPNLALRLLAPMRQQAIAASAVRGASTAGSHLDQVVVGALLGPVPFAHYNLGKRIEMAFLGVSATFAATLFQPYFAASEPGHRGAAVRKALLILTATVGLGTACFVATADLVVARLLGAPWLPAVPAAIILALGGHLRAIASLHTALLSVSGRNAIVFRALVGTTLLGVPLVALGALHGAAVAALAALLRVAVSAGLLIASTRRDIDGSTLLLHLRHAALPFLGMVAAALLGRVAVTGTGWAAADLPPLQSGLALLAAVAGAGAVAAGLLLRQRRPARRAVPLAAAGS
ncbi:oligosaccharide flippase family protein [Roseicella aquatilis]|uniref:oligosaccharide flippase family protein n=1 Tax=Roseicella aquatilis TaxID=2527868 RepID=UPI0014053EBA|nr:oligosaccharide flippase family protein [Roseicella aquatilis]